VIRKSRVLSIVGFQMREELVVRERMAPVDPHEALDRAVHHIAVDPPLEQIADQEDERDDQPIGPARVVDMRDEIGQCGRADRINHNDVHFAAVPGRDPRPIIGTEAFLPLGHHNRAILAIRRLSYCVGMALDELSENI